MDKTKNASWLAKVEIKEAIDGRAQVYIDGRLVPGELVIKLNKTLRTKEFRF